MSKEMFGVIVLSCFVISGALMVLLALIMCAYSYFKWEKIDSGAPIALLICGIVILFFSALIVSA